MWGEQIHNIIMYLNRTQRLEVLLNHLTATELRGAPTGVGLRTALEARDLGFVEIVMKGRVAAYRLTKAGTAARATQR